MKKLIFLIFVLSVTACDKDETSTNSADWAIPADEVFDGGPGKDGIPSVDSPDFSSSESIDDDGFMDDDDLIIGVFRNGLVGKGYPHPILDWHEIVNDNIGDLNFALTYCPLTGTGVSWNRDINGKTTTFGVSGKLYNTNLMPYDRETDSYWSQLRLDCINGELLNTRIETTQIIETTWATWKKAFPNAVVMNTATGFNRNYNSYPYGDYRTNHNNIIFPVSNMDDRLLAKERVLGVILDNAEKVYSIELFETDRVIFDNIDGIDNVVIGSKADNFIVAFEDPKMDNLRFVADQLPVIAEDDNGNKITLSGKVVEGPSQGIDLVPLNSFMGYFFAFGTFYEDMEVFTE